MVTSETKGAARRREHSGAQRWCSTAANAIGRIGRRNRVVPEDDPMPSALSIQTEMFSMSIF